MRRKMADRRIRPRFDIVGDLWGTLETVLRLPLRNVSRGGRADSLARAAAFAVCPSPRVSAPMDRTLTVPVRVSHVDAQVSADGERTYLIGVEFSRQQPALLAVRRSHAGAAAVRRGGGSLMMSSGYLTTERRQTPRVALDGQSNAGSTCARA